MLRKQPVITPRIPVLYLRATPQSVRFRIYRNGICLETLGTISSYGGLNVVNLNLKRLTYWLSKGVHIHSALFGPISSANNYLSRDELIK